MVSGAWNKGLKMSKEFCEKNSKAHIGLPSPNKGKTKYQHIYFLNICWCGKIVYGNKSYCWGHNKGFLNKQHLEKSEEKISEIRKFKKIHPINEWKNGHDTWNKNKHGLYSIETLEKMSKARLGKPTGRLPTPSTCWGKGCYYNSPLQRRIWLRSSYELAYAKYLDSQNKDWLYEVYTFNLGETTYTPDFFLPKFEKFIEVKGYMRPEAQEKINMFLEQYPWDLEVLFKEDLINLGCEFK